ncbi:MAG: 5-formyltetrahydrofolate cyclo-ligase [Phycisphaerales bacterium]
MRPDKEPAGPSSAAPAPAPQADEPSLDELRVRKVLARRAWTLRLRTLAPGERQDRSALICERLSKLGSLGGASRVMLFAPMANATIPEVDLTELARRWLRRGRPAIYVPRVLWSSREMIPALVTDWERDLVIGRHGVREPGPECPSLDPEHLDVVLAPGLAFDHGGRRLGRGGGLYDRFLGRYALSDRAVGVCFDRQISTESRVDSLIPVASHDARVHAVVSESRLIELPPGSLR